ncbi:hypothetical protein LINPERHAP2_LOCUS480 [Linum perenne]
MEQCGNGKRFFVAIPADEFQVGWSSWVKSLQSVLSTEKGDGVGILSYKRPFAEVLGRDLGGQSLVRGAACSQLVVSEVKSSVIDIFEEEVEARIKRLKKWVSICFNLGTNGFVAWGDFLKWLDRWWGVKESWEKQRLGDDSWLIECESEEAVEKIIVHLWSEKVHLRSEKVIREIGRRCGGFIACEETGFSTIHIKVRDEGRSLLSMVLKQGDSCFEVAVVEEPCFGEEAPASCFEVEVPASMTAHEETKLSDVDRLIVFRVLGRWRWCWEAVKACGSRGGLLTVWDEEVESVSLSRIHRVLVSSSWEDHFLDCCLRACTRTCSDHNSLVLDCAPERIIRRPWRFELMWLDFPDFGERNEVVIKDTLDKISALDDLEETNQLSKDDILERCFLKCDLEKLWKREEIAWIGEEVLVDEDLLALGIVDFYKDLLSERREDRPFPSAIGFRRFEQSETEDLIRPFFEEEVWDVVRKSASDKAPGPDGISMGLIKAHWEVSRNRGG